MKQSIDRETWLTKAAEHIMGDIIAPVLACEPPNWPFKVSVGFPPNTRATSKVLAVCCKKEASAAGYSEIFVTPQMDDSIEILAALVHELVHYSDNCQSGHKGHFERVARAVGLEGKLTATVAGVELKVRLFDIVDDLGDIPHAKLDLSATGKNKQTTRMLKIECSVQECGFTFRTSAAQLAKINFNKTCCPACMHPNTLTA